MKKIMLLVLATLTLVLVSCGVNSLNPEKLELQKLPKVPAAKIAYESATGGTQDTTVNYYKMDGASLTGIPTGKVSVDYTVGTTTTEVQNPNISIIPDNTTSGDYTVIVSNAPKPSATLTVDVTFQVIALDPTVPTALTGDIFGLSKYKPTEENTITTTQEKYKISGYEATRASDGNPTHIAYTAEAKKDSKVFSSPTFEAITAVGADGEVDLPIGSTANGYDGGTSKIWVLEVDQPSGL